jgi:amidohydrolase family protein
MSHRLTWATLGFSLLAWAGIGLTAPDPAPTPTPTPAPEKPAPKPKETPTPKKDPKKGPEKNRRAPGPKLKLPKGKKPKGKKPKGKQPKKAPAKKPAKKKKAPKKKEHVRTPRPGPVTLIKNARMVGVRGSVNVVLSKGKITAISSRPLPPQALKQLKVQLTIDGKGGRIGPGRIDAWASVGDALPLGRALDAFDPYDSQALNAALSQGVTTVFLNPMRGAQSSGQGAVIKLIPGGTREEILVKEGLALHAGLGLSQQTLTGSLTDGQSLQKYFEQVRNYQDSWIEYEEKLKKYEKELKKFAATQNKGKGAKGAKPGAKKGPTRPTRRPVRRMPSRRPTRGAPPKGAPSKGKPTAPKKKKGPKKPAQPPTDRGLALAGKVLDGELPLRIEAHRYEDIVNALELQKAFGFKMILEGVSEGHLLAEELAEAKVTVILGSPRLGEDRSRFPLRTVTDLAARLEAAGVELIVGSDGWAKSGSLPEAAALHVASGLSYASGEAAITSRPAKLLGLDKTGKLERGFAADVVLYAPSEFGAEAVRAVFIDGRLVYQRSAQ